MSEYVQAYEPTTDAPLLQGGESLSVDSMLSLLDELDQEGYEQAMTELEVINSIEASLHVHY